MISQGSKISAPNPLPATSVYVGLKRYWNRLTSLMKFSTVQRLAANHGWKQRIVVAGLQQLSSIQLELVVVEV